MTNDRDDIAARLERLATRMFQSGNWGSDLETVKDAKDTILGLRTCLEAACSDAKEAETFAEELLAKDREPMPGEIRAVNYVVGEKDGEPIFNFRLEQYAPTSRMQASGQWARRVDQWRWVPIRIYEEGENGTLKEILR